MQTGLALITGGCPAYSVLPIDAKLALSVRDVDRGLVPDMPDRIIAAVALATGLPLITKDRKIRTVPGVACIG